MSARVGHWFATFTGRQFWPIDPHVDDVCIEDIAHALSQICRFGGHCRDFYSVAQHSVLVSNTVRPEDAFWGLMHDAAEAYVGDMIWPMKRAVGLAAFHEIEHNVMLAVARRFGLKTLEPADIKRADLVLLSTEKRDLMAPRSTEAATGVEIAHARHAGRLAWDTDCEPLKERIVAWAPHLAEAEFLRRFWELSGETP